MSEVSVQPATRADLPRITEIYNHYVFNTPVTFDVEPYAVERREAWFDQFAPTGRYRLLVAEGDGIVVGYAGTTRFRPKAAYDTTVETTVYCAPEATGKGIGARLYSALFNSIAVEDITERCVGCAPQPLRIHPRWCFHREWRKFGQYWDVAWTQRPLPAA